MKIAVMTTAFYPDPVVGAVRMTQWVRRFVARGCEVFVVARAGGPQGVGIHHPIDGVTVLRLPGMTVGKNAVARPRANGGDPIPGSPDSGRRLRPQSVARRVIDRISVPDASVWGIRRDRRQALAFLRQCDPDVLLSSSPPHSIHGSAFSIVDRLHVPWVADFRDPLIIDSRYRDVGRRTLRNLLRRGFEDRVHRNSDAVIHTIPIHHRWARLRYPDRRERFRLIPNGAPEGLSPIGRTDRSSEAPRPFVVFSSSTPPASEIGRFAGVLRAAGVDREILIHCCGRGEPSRSSIGPGVQLQILGRIPHADVLRRTAEADLLLAHLPAERSRTMGFSSKLNEYLAVGRPVVIVNPTLPDRQFLRRWPIATVIDPTSPSEAGRAVRRVLDHAARGGDATATAFYQAFNRPDQADAALEVLRSVVDADVG